LNESLLHKLSRITPEEQSILEGRSTIDRTLYMQDGGNTIRSGKLLASGKLITVRPHTRFIHFPAHCHDYVEVVYMCRGTTTHLIGSHSVCLREGELLFLSTHVTHEVCRAEETDVAVNFIVLPAFFATTLSTIGEVETPLRRFVVDCLCSRSVGPGYLHFRVAEVPAVQNLIENLLWTQLEETPFPQKTAQMTMSLLFLQLLGHTDTLLTGDGDGEVILRVLRYVESGYVSGSFADLTQQLHYDPSWLSREIKRKTGKTFTQLIQEKRLAQAVFLLKNTDANVADISAAVGYENVSYFHRIFCAAYGRSPKHLRDEI